MKFQAPPPISLKQPLRVPISGRFVFWFEPRVRKSACRVPQVRGRTSKHGRLSFKVQPPSSKDGARSSKLGLRSPKDQTPSWEVGRRSLKLVSLTHWQSFKTPSPFLKPSPSPRGPSLLSDTPAEDGVSLYRPRGFVKKAIKREVKAFSGSCLIVEGIEYRAYRGQGHLGLSA